MSNPTPGVLERITRLETEMSQVLASQKEFRDSWAKVDDKLDTLLSLKDKGAGAFWLASSLAGIGAISIFFQVLTWVGALLGKH